MENIRDYNESLKRYDAALNRLLHDERISKKNRELCYEWVKLKEKELTDGKSKDERAQDAHRHAKTLAKYCTLLTNISFWFPDLTAITKKDLEKFKDNFLNDKIKSVNGKILKEKNDYIRKVIKSPFFKKYLGHRDIVEDVFSNRVKDKKTRPQFFLYDDLKELVSSCRYNDEKAILYLLFSTGVRIGTLLNLKFEDFELKYNSKTDMQYYLCHVKAEYTKSNADRAVPIVIPEVNEFLIKHFQHATPTDFVVNVSYASVRNLIERTASSIGLKTKPDNQPITPHIYRKSTSLFLLNNGYSLDQVKAFLGHSPSSDAIDCYANYSGLNFDPQTTKVQVDEFMKLKDKLKSQDLKMNVLLQQNDDIQRKQQLTEDVILKMAQLIDDQQLVNNPVAFKGLYETLKSKRG